MRIHRQKLKIGPCHHKAVNGIDYSLVRHIPSGTGLRAEHRLDFRGEKQVIRDVDGVLGDIIEMIDRLLSRALLLFFHFGNDFIRGNAKSENTGYRYGCNKERDEPEQQFETDRQV
ncbi:hypothetical protein D3C84_993020 [compost metagenome]